MLTGTKSAFFSNPDPQPQWYALRTRSRFEKKLMFSLSGQLIETFLPTIRTVGQWKDRVKHLEKPLFPGYLFVRCARGSREYYAALNSLGSAGFVGTFGVADPIPEQQISAFKQVLEAQMPLAIHPQRFIGREIEIISGALSGVRGILVMANQLSRIVLQVDFIQQAASLEIDTCNVRYL